MDMCDVEEKYKQLEARHRHLELEYGRVALERDMAKRREKDLQRRIDRYKRQAAATTEPHSSALVVSGKVEVTSKAYAPAATAKPAAAVPSSSPPAPPPRRAPSPVATQGVPVADATLVESPLVGPHAMAAPAKPPNISIPTP